MHTVYSFEHRMWIFKKPACLVSQCSVPGHEAFQLNLESLGAGRLWGMSQHPSLTSGAAEGTGAGCV